MTVDVAARARPGSLLRAVRVLVKILDRQRPWTIDDAYPLLPELAALERRIVAERRHMEAVIERDLVRRGARVRIIGGVEFERARLTDARPADAAKLLADLVDAAGGTLDGPTGELVAEAVSSFPRFFVDEFALDALARRDPRFAAAVRRHRQRRTRVGERISVRDRRNGRGR